jgi:hypothetical protein
MVGLMTIAPLFTSVGRRSAGDNLSSTLVPLYDIANELGPSKLRWARDIY